MPNIKQTIEARQTQFKRTALNQKKYRQLIKILFINSQFSIKYIIFVA